MARGENFRGLTLQALSALCLYFFRRLSSFRPHHAVLKYKVRLRDVQWLNDAQRLNDGHS